MNRGLRDRLYCAGPSSLNPLAGAHSPHRLLPTSPTNPRYCGRIIKTDFSAGLVVVLEHPLEDSRKIEVLSGPGEEGSKREAQYQSALFVNNCVDIITGQEPRRLVAYVARGVEVFTAMLTRRSTRFVLTLDCDLG